MTKIQNTSIFQGVCEFEHNGTHYRATDGDGIPARQVQILSVYVKRGSAYEYEQRVVCKRNPRAILRALAD